MNEYEAQNEYFYNYGILKKGEYDFLDNLYTNKKVAIVGPAATMVGSGLGEYIDSFDTVIRLNRSIPVNPELKDDIGTKVDVLYHTLAKLSKKTSIVEHMSIDAYERANLKALVVSMVLNNHRLADLRVYYDNNFKDDVERIPTRTINDFIIELKRKMGDTPKNGPNTGLIAIEHVLTYPVKKLFLCGFDFYDTYYYDGYGGVDDRKRKKSWINKCHNIDMHREYTAGLYKDNDHVEIDEVMKNIFEREGLILE